jgi:predicted amidohydrolase YtcJ
MAAWEWDEWEILKAYRRQRQPLVRVSVRTPLAEWRRCEAELAAGEGGGDWLPLAGVKAFVDGSLGSSTALFFAPYEDMPGNCGLLMQPPEVLRAELAAADRAGLQMDVHAIGDKAVSILLDIYAAVAAENGPRDRRPRVEHAQHLAAGDIGRLAALGTVASVQPSHLVDDGCWAEKRIGGERARMTYAFRSLQAAGVPLAFGTDWPVTALSPLAAIQAAVTRQTADGLRPDGWQPGEKLDVAAAVAAYTAGSAYADFAEGDKGTLTAGKLADFVILSKDIFTLPPAAIASSEVILTVCGGRVVYRK